MDASIETTKECQHLLHTIRCKKITDYKWAKRNLEAPMPPRMKNVLCILVLMHTPWKIIAMIMYVATRFCRTVLKNTFLSTQEIQDLAEEALKTKPQLITQADDINHEETLCAKRWLYEYRLAVWLAEQNLKGIAVPVRMGIDYYLVQWGHGPHQERVTKHLHKFQARKTWKKWMHEFRRQWGFDYASCPKGPALSEPEIADKAFALTFKQPLYTCPKLVPEQPPKNKPNLETK